MNKKSFIYLTAFFCGMAIMAVELSATRLLAPYFGTSMIIWTIVIGLIMISLSLGNYLGGRAADKYRDPDKLFYWIWIAAIWIAVIPFVGKYIISLSVLIMIMILPNQLLVAGSVFSSLTIFSFPLVILGMASPYLVKLGAIDLNNNGKTTGTIYSLSTIGSIIGTFIPTFLTIPTTGIGTSKTFLIFALILNLLCLYYYLSKKQKVIRTVISALFILAFLFIPINNSYAFWKPVLLEDESTYNYLQVYNSNDTVVLSTNVAFGVQSVYRKNTILSNNYYDYLLMAPLFNSDFNINNPLEVLILGFGAGTYAKECHYFFPNSNIDGVEIDQKIISISKQYFGLTDQDAHIFLNDGRAFLLTPNARKYDLILVDAYHDITIPFHMSTREFFAEVKEHLKKNGILAININIHSNTNTELIDYFTQTVKAEFGKVYRCDIDSLSNSMIVASDNPDCQEAFLKNSNNNKISNLLYPYYYYVRTHLTEITESKLVFTDEVAPVEIMGQKVLDEYVKEGLSYFTSRLKNSKNKFQELLNIVSEN